MKKYGIFSMNDPKLSLLSNDIKKAQEQQLLRDDIQDREAHNLQANLTVFVKEIGTKTLGNITDLSSQVVDLSAQLDLISKWKNQAIKNNSDRLSIFS